MTRLRRISCAGLLLAVTGTAIAQPKKAPPVPEQPPPPPPGPDPETQAKLDAQAAAIAAANDALAAQQKQLADLAAKQAADAAKAADDAHKAQGSAATALSAEHDERLAADAKLAAIPTVRSAWPQVSLGGFLQVDATMRQSSQDELKQSGDLLNQDRFYVRRARPKLSAAYGKVGGVIEMDVNTVTGGQVRPSMVEASYQAASWLKAELGIVKIPFGFEVEQSDKERLFLERSNGARALFPGEYDLGAKVGGGWKFLRYAVAVQNGEPVGEKGYTLRDPNRAKDVSARGGFETNQGDVTVSGGFSFLTGKGFHAGTPATKDQLVWRDLNEDGVVNTGEIQVIAGQAATPSANFDRFGLGVDAELAVDLHDAGKLLIYGEIVAAGNLDRATVVADPIAMSRDARELGWYVGAVVEPTSWSALGGRYDSYDPDTDASEVRTGSIVPVDQHFSTLAFTTALRYQHGRLILEWDHNRNHIGRTTAGVPTNLNDDAITLRAEVQL